MPVFMLHQEGEGMTEIVSYRGDELTNADLSRRKTKIIATNEQRPTYAKK
jgi:hypothetical protein